MSDKKVYVRRYSKTVTEANERFAVNEREVWRYAGYLGIPGEENEELLQRFQKVKQMTSSGFSYQVCYLRVPIEWENELPVLPFVCSSKDLSLCLKGSEEVVLFAATIGMDIDRQIKKTQYMDPTAALLMQALGAERVECLCDVFCQEIKEELKAETTADGVLRTCTPRFSPGYGDLPLELQKDFVRLLDCSRQIGVSLNESLLLSPSKSVTAIMGIKPVN